MLDDINRNRESLVKNNTHSGTLPAMPVPGSVSSESAASGLLSRDGNRTMDSTDRDGDADISATGHSNKRPPETGGPKGPDPTRYGDWERGGRCIDF